MKQENYVIGLDLGINNVGWSILDLDNHKIEKCGVRLFNPSEDAQNRRSARSVRRRLKREKNRINDSLKLFASIGFPIKTSIDVDLLHKRVLALNNKVEKEDIINIVKYMMSHRGYIPFDDEEVNFVNLDGKYPCEYYYDILQKNGKFRAQNETVKTNELKIELNDILDKQIEYYSELSKIKDQIMNIFSRKREFWEGPGSEKSLTPYGRFKSDEDITEYNNNKLENPLYEKYLFEELIGKCNVIYLNEPCAPIANIHAQKFNLINDFINLTFKDVSDAKSLKYFIEVSDGYKLNDVGLNEIINYCMNSYTTLKLDKIFKDVLNLKVENASGFRVDKNGKKEMSTMDAYRTILREFTKENIDIPIWISDYDLYNKFIYYINVVPSSTILIDMLKNDKDFSNNISDNMTSCIKVIYNKINKDYNGYHSLSEKALIKSNEDMLSSCLNYQQVRKKFNYDKDFKEECVKNYITTSGKLKISDKHIDELIASPQVKKTLRQSIKVINAIISEKKALPYCISIESEKEVNGAERIKEINKEQKIRETLRKNAIEIIEKNNYRVSEILIEKVMLYDEINGYCPYCSSQKIDLKDVLDNRIKVEHILPISKSADDSYNNKTISCEKCNDEKSNRTPYEWLRNSNYEDFKNRITENSNFSEDKKKNFLFEEDLNKYSIRFINRNLRDTAYATKELINQINMFNYYIEDKYDKKIKTLSTPGQITYKIRKNYELKKDRDIGKFHHAVDACIVASIADTNIGKMIIDSQNESKYWILDRQRAIDSEKQRNLEKYLDKVNLDDYYRYIKNIDDDSKINISSQVCKSVQGQLSNSNINKFIKIDNDLYKVSQINNIYEENTSDLQEYFNDDSVKVHLMIRDNNPKLYEKLKSIYNDYKNQKGNPFKNYVFDKCRNEKDLDDIKEFNPLKHGIKSSDNPNSPVVIKLRYYSKVTSPYLLESEKYNKKTDTLIGLDSLKQYCVEVYHDIDENTFAFLPIYSISMDLNNKKINKSDSYYLELKEKYLKNHNVKFITSIYNGNYLKIEKKNGEFKEGIYECFHKTNNIIIIKNGFNFTKSDLSFTLYDVDVLGNKKERLTYSIK